MQQPLKFTELGLFSWRHASLSYSSKPRLCGRSECRMVGCSLRDRSQSSLAVLATWRLDHTQSQCSVAEHGLLLWCWGDLGPGRLGSAQAGNKSEKKTNRSSSEISKSNQRCGIKNRAHGPRSIPHVSTFRNCDSELSPCKASICWVSC